MLSRIIWQLYTFLASKLIFSHFPIIVPSSNYAFPVNQNNTPGLAALEFITSPQSLLREVLQLRRTVLALDKDDDENARVLPLHDFGIVPHRTTQTFQLVDSDWDARCDPPRWF